MNNTNDTYKTGQFALTVGQLDKLLLTFDSVQDKAMIALAATIGLRREDLVTIRRNDYNPNNGSITYYEHKKKKIRTVFIPSQKVIQLLNMHINSCRKNDWLFPSPKETGKYKNAHVSSRHVYDIYNEHLAKAGIKSPTGRNTRPFHSLRATCYKLCQKKGWTQRQACELIGDSLRVAEEHYNAPSEEEMRTLAEEQELF